MRRNVEVEATLVEKYSAISDLLDERARRRWAAAESRALGYGGDALVSAATGIARATIREGRRELEAGVEIDGRVRRPGAGRPKLQQVQPGLREALEGLVEPLTRGDPLSALRWTCKSGANLAAELSKQGWRVSSTSVGRMLPRARVQLAVAPKDSRGQVASGS